MDDNPTVDTVEAVVEEEKQDEEKELTPEDLTKIALAEMPDVQRGIIEQVQAQGVKMHAIPIFESVLGDEKTWFAYRTIKRREWHKLQFEHRQRLQVASKEAGNENITQQEAESMFEDAVVTLCSIAPKIEFDNIGAFDAGAITTLADAIMFSSGFNQNSVPVKL